VKSRQTKAGLTSANNAGLLCSTARRHVISAATYSDWHKYASAVHPNKQCQSNSSRSLRRPILKK